MKAIKFFFIHLVCLLPSLAFAGTAHYVDANAARGGDGSWARPFKSITEVKAHRFVEGDDLYFKVGQTFRVPPETFLNFSWGGNSRDRATLGAYYGNNQFGLNGGARPILDANNAAPFAAGHSGGGPLVKAGLPYDKGHTGYITISDLELRDSNGYGISIYGKVVGTSDSISNCYIDNCYINSAAHQGIIITGVSHSYVQNNILFNTNNILGTDRDGWWAGAALELDGDSGGGAFDRTHHNTVRYNYLKDSGHEGIGVNQGANHNIIEYNVVCNTKTAYIYLENTQDNTVRYNLCYFATDGRWAGTKYRGWGVTIENESFQDRIYVWEVRDHKVYGNFMAGMNRGISLLNQGANVGKYLENNKFSNNTIVDCDSNIYFQSNNTNWRGNEINNNNSYTITRGMKHSSHYSPYGVTWAGNSFNDKVTGNAASGSNDNLPVLANEAGWRSLKVGDHNSDFFKATIKATGPSPLSSFFRTSSIGTSPVTLKAPGSPASISISISE